MLILILFDVLLTLGVALGHDGLIVKAKQIETKLKALEAKVKKL